MHGDTTPVDEGFLSSLGVHRIPIPVPFAEAGGPVNAWAILDEDGRWTLFDTGVSTPDGIAALRGGAAEAGVDLRRLSRIIVSHGHVDHYGNAQLLAEESGARVYVHPDDVTKVLGQERFHLLLTRHRGYFLSALGVPAELMDRLTAQAAASRPVSRAVDEARLERLSPGQRFRFRHFDGELLHCPGHTPGLVCLYAAGPRLLFANDHLLAKVSPNPLLDLSQGEGDTKFRALVRYVESAQAVRALDLAAVLPGHGPSFTGHRALIDGLLAFYVRRQDKLLARVTSSPASVYEALEALFPRREPRLLVLMLSEVLGNLEVLETQRRVRRTQDGDVTRYAPA
ncbi:MAG: MBL fold metallo-hydrolase [Myxococcota bacterium]|jgi:glyoxylase-like metal-dependent hydrolase (beta-lactamase superfamily II)